MLSDFFRFPHIAYLAWLGAGAPRDDKVLSRAEIQALLADEVTVEEKLDGANVGLSLGPDGELRAQNRGQYLAQTHTGQFARLPAWLSQHGDALRSNLTPDRMLFGEWCAARHSLDYRALPDWFLLFDVYDRTVGRFWSASKRNELAGAAGLAVVPLLFRGHTTLPDLKRLVLNQQSACGSGAMEGVVVRHESAEWCLARAKLVRPDFTQSIDTHWRRRTIEWNRVRDPTLSRR